MIEELMMSASGTLEGERLDVLTTLVENHDLKHYPLDFPNPVEAIESLNPSDS